MVVAVERTAVVIREDEPGPSIFFAGEEIIPVDDIATLEHWPLIVGHWSSSMLGWGSLGACSRQVSVSSAPSWALNSAVARS